MSMVRCGWVTTEPLYLDYHDQEWGTPITDTRKLFEMLCLEGQQAGLSWITVLKKRENYRQAFYNFEPQRLAIMTEQDIKDRLQDSGLIRHSGKLNAIVTNAKAYLAMEAAGENFVTFIWHFVNGEPLVNHWVQPSDVPASTSCSIALSKALKKRGFKFVGPTICYAFMQACGLVNDHLTHCFCHPKQQHHK